MGIFLGRSGAPERPGRTHSSSSKPPDADLGLLQLVAVVIERAVWRRALIR